MSTHNISFYGEIMKIVPKLYSDTLLICFTVIVNVSHFYLVSVKSESTIYYTVISWLFGE